MIRLASLLLLLIGLYGVLTTKNVIKMIISINIMELGVNIFIISVGFITNGVAPNLTEHIDSSLSNFVDPLPQALVLTSIVIGLGITSLGLAFARKMNKKYGTYDLTMIGGMKDE
ncbi:MAG: NADH-quinone oxidoreductase subunit K [Clostridiales bacterium]|nr:NADH-quinone oxidoreductase subunit K [Clostridiales bacterium]